MTHDRIIAAFRRVDASLTKSRRALLLAAIVSSTFVALELTGVADLDASFDRTLIFAHIRLEVFQLLLGAVVAVFLVHGYVRVALWAVRPLDEDKG